MAKATKKKKSTSKVAPKKTAPKKPHEDTMYVALDNPVEKRKSLLSALKVSLILQEEVEKLAEARLYKKQLLAEMKQDMAEISSSYESLKQYLPNVKDALSYTEKEISTLQNSIQSVKASRITTDEALELNRSEIETPVSSTPQPKKEKEVSRLDRIQNNLKVLESKLKGIQ